MKSASSNGHVDWSRRGEVFDRLDYKAALEDFGMEVVGKPNAKGWAEVKIDADDRNPSASYNVHTGAIHNHRDGWTVSLLDLRVREGKAADVTESFVYYATSAGVDVRKTAGPAKTRTDGRVIASYRYVDEHGDVLAIKHRRANKKFFWDPTWPAGPKVLYRLPELLAANPAEMVHIGEGEKDADRLAGLGLVATTLFASKGPWLPEYSEALAGREVAIYEDNDEPGRECAAMVAHGLWGHAKTIRVVSFTDLPEKGDVSDWLDLGHDRDALMARVLQTDQWIPGAGNSAECAEIADRCKEEWPELRWFEPRPDPGAPLWVLPERLGSLCRALGKAYGVDPGVPMVMMLGMAGGAIGKAWAFSPIDGWTEYPSVYMALVMDPGGGKSPVREFLRGPLEDIESGLVAEGQGLRLLVGDITIESLARILQKNPRGVLATYDELVELLAGLGQYKSGGKGNDVAKVNKLWSHETFTVDRVEDQKAGKEPIRVVRPNWSIFGNLTPAKLGSLGQANTDGSLERWLCSMPDLLPAMTLKQRGPLDPQVSGAWRDLIIKLRACRATDGKETGIIALDRDGLNEWENCEAPHCAEMNDPAFDVSLRGTWKKMDSQACRLAGTVAGLHAIDRNISPTGMATPWLAKAAWALVEYFKAHHLRTLDVGGMRIPRGARLIIAWLLNHPGTTSFSRRDITQTYSKPKYDPDDIDDGFHWLHGRNAIRPVREELEQQHQRKRDLDEDPKEFMERMMDELIGGRPGRKPSPRWEVHPDLIPAIKRTRPESQPQPRP